MALPRALKSSTVVLLLLLGATLWVVYLSREDARDYRTRAPGATRSSVASTPVAPESPGSNRVTYRIVDQWAIPNGGFGRVIVVPESSATEQALRALGEQLKVDTKRDRNAFVCVYSSARAASMRQAAMGDTISKADAAFYDAHFVAVYNRNANTGNHQLTLTPDGLNGRQIDIAY